MKKDRRHFLKQTGLLASVTLLQTSPLLSLASCTDANKKVGAFGVQLYSVKEDMAKDPVATIKAISTYGYKQIESFEGAKGMFWGMQPKEFKTMLDDLGLTIISSHCDTKKDFEKKAEDAASIGMKYLINPYVGRQKSINDFKNIADQFNKNGEICKNNGIRFAYHNHDYTYQPVDNELPVDVLMNNTDKDLVDYEMDIYWVVAAGKDPLEYMKKYDGRYKLCHVKDYAKTPDKTKSNNSVDLGTGSINFADVLGQSLKYGMKYFVVEQEAFINSTPLKSIKIDADYMKNLNIK